MNNIELENITLINFNKDDKNHLIILKELLNDNSITERFQGFLHNLNSKNEFFRKGFLVEIQGKIIGYIDIGNYNKTEDAVYLRSAVLKEERKKGYGRLILNDTCNYIFNEYPFVEEIKVKVEGNNIASLKMIEKANFKWIRDDYYGFKNPYINKK